LALSLGCADPYRHVVAKPYLAEPPTPETIFGEATFGKGASPGGVGAIQAPVLPSGGTLSLDDCLVLAQRVSPALDSAQLGQLSAQWSQWQAVTQFLPTGGLGYGVTHYDNSPSYGVSNYNNASAPLTGMGRDQFSWQIGFNQPLFTGGRLSANYFLSRLGVEASAIQTTQSREDLLLSVKEAYFAILATEKALAVAKTSVVNLSSHLNSARNFFDVGMVPRNQVLAAEVELAQAQQEETTQERNLVVNTARLNILLRQAPDGPLKIADALRYYPFPLTLERCLELGLQNNPEILLGKNQVEAGAKGVDLARADLYPQFSLAYTHSSTGNTPRAHGGWSADSSSWNIAAVMSFNFWEWGRVRAEVEKSKVALNQAIDQLTSLEDLAKLEITTNYQGLLSAGRNIDTSAKAVVSAAEDLRMVTERYQEQVATNTEVLDAQTRYSQAQYEHFAALYNYNLAWAALERSLGQRVLPQGTIG
jgi:outer membrane protein